MDILEQVKLLNQRVKELNSAREKALVEINYLEKNIDDAVSAYNLEYNEKLTKEDLVVNIDKLVEEATTALKTNVEKLAGEIQKIERGEFPVEADEEVKVEEVVAKVEDEDVAEVEVEVAKVADVADEPVKEVIEEPAPVSPLAALLNRQKAADIPKTPVVEQVKEGYNPSNSELGFDLNDLEFGDTEENNKVDVVFAPPKKEETDGSEMSSISWFEQLRNKQIKK
jgi:hypothetical protein